MSQGQRPRCRARIAAPSPAPGSCPGGSRAIFIKSLSPPPLAPRPDPDRLGSAAGADPEARRGAALGPGGRRPSRRLRCDEPRHRLGAGLMTARPHRKSQRQIDRPYHSRATRGRTQRGSAAGRGPGHSPTRKRRGRRTPGKGPGSQKARGRHLADSSHGRGKVATGRNLERQLRPYGPAPGRRQGCKTRTRPSPGPSPTRKCRGRLTHGARWRPAVT